MLDPVVDIACGDFHSLLLCNEQDESASASIFFSGQSRSHEGETTAHQFESLPNRVSVTKSQTLMK